MKFIPLILPFKMTSVDDIRGVVPIRLLPKSLPCDGPGFNSRSGTVYLSSLKSFTRDSKWGCRL